MTFQSKQTCSLQQNSLKQDKKGRSPITRAIVSPSNSFFSAYSLYVMPSRTAVLNISISVTVGTVFLLSFNITRDTLEAEWLRMSDRPSRPCYTLLKALKNERNLQNNWMGTGLHFRVTNLGFKLGLHHRWVQKKQLRNTGVLLF